MILGCDPGLSGALAYYDGRELSLVDMPTRVSIINRKSRRVIDEEEVLGRIELFAIYGAEVLVIEDVHGMPGQSGPAAFTFGYGVGIVTAAALAKGLKLEKVHPATWKTALGVPADKSACRRRATELFTTDVTKNFSRVKDDGRAEAALIALWGWKTRGRLEAPTDARQQGKDVSTRDLKSLLPFVHAEISAEMRGYGHGTGPEGYAGGYQQALYDVQAVINGTLPSDPWGFWRRARQARSLP